jgi:hypothetical protein
MCAGAYIPIHWQLLAISTLLDKEARGPSFHLASFLSGLGIVNRLGMETGMDKKHYTRKEKLCRQ